MTDDLSHSSTDSLSADPLAPGPSRRTLLGRGALAAAVLPLGTGLLAKSAFAFAPGAVPGHDLLTYRDLGAPAILRRTAGPGGTPLRKLTLTWNNSAPCVAPVLVAAERGYYAKHGLEVELINFGQSTEQMLEGIATRKADAGVGMALRWLKPLEQGFDVKITAGTHGGCMRLLAPSAAGIKSLTELKGKTIAVADMAAPGKNFFAIMLKKAGLDPDNDVVWRQFPGDLLRAAVEKGEAQALVDGDPKTYLWLKDGQFSEIASNLDGEYAKRTCCIVGVSGKLIRDEPQIARALTLALLDAAQHAVREPADTARLFLGNAPKIDVADLEAMVRYHTHTHTPVGPALKKEIALYAEELKLVSVLKPSTNVEKFADRVFADVLSV